MLVLALVLPACAPAATETPVVTEKPVVTETQVATQETVITEAPATEEAVVNPNVADYTYVGNATDVFPLNSWYADVGVEANVEIRNAGAVKVPDDMTTEMPKAKEKYTIGFSVYYTVDEVGSMILETMKSAAVEAGVELLVNNPTISR